MKAIDKISKETHRENANIGNNFSSKLLQIASSSNKVFNLLNMPEWMSKAHEDGDIHIHDLDSYNLTINCLQIDVEEVLKRGFNTGYGKINPPGRIESAAALMCILLQSSQNDMFGGQSIFSLEDTMRDYVVKTEQEIIKEVNEALQLLPEGDINSREYDKLIRTKLEKRVRQAMQAIVYNLNSMHSRAGSQVPFSSINLGIPRDEYGEMVCRMF